MVNVYPPNKSWFLGGSKRNTWDESLFWHVHNDGHLKGHLVSASQADKSPVIMSDHNAWHARPSSDVIDTIRENDQLNIRKAKCWILKRGEKVLTTLNANKTNFLIHWGVRTVRVCQALIYHKLYHASIPNLQHVTFWSIIFIIEYNV